MLLYIYKIIKKNVIVWSRRQRRPTLVEKSPELGPIPVHSIQVLADGIPDAAVGRALQEYIWECEAIWDLVLYLCFLLHSLLLACGFIPRDQLPVLHVRSEFGPPLLANPHTATQASRGPLPPRQGHQETALSIRGQVHAADTPLLHSDLILSSLRWPQNPKTPTLQLFCKYWYIFFVLQ